MKEAITIYKLIILYTLDRIRSPLTLGLIADYITDRGYTNYFNVQNAFAALLDGKPWNYFIPIYLTKYGKKLTNTWWITITKS